MIDDTDIAALKPFLAKLAAVPGHWALDDGLLRHASLTDGSGTPCCPILACLPEPRRDRVDNDNAIDLGDEVGLEQEAADLIIRAADGERYNGMSRVRNALLVACKLEEPDVVI